MKKTVGHGHHDDPNQAIQPRFRTIDGPSIRFAESEARSDHALLLCPASAFPLQLGDVLREWVEAPDLDPYRRVDGREVVQRAMSVRCPP
jgi:hypothetical protein